MLTILLTIAALVWVPFALGLLRKRPLTVLLVWLVVGPVVTNVVRWPGANPFFWSGGNERAEQGHYYEESSSVTVKEMLEPSRLVIVMMVGVFALTRITTRRRGIPIDGPELRMALFSALLVASAILFSSRMLFGLRIALDVFMIPFLAYFLARRLVQEEKDFRRLKRFVGYLGLYVIVACALERVVNTQLLYRLKGPFVQGLTRGSSILHVVLIVILFVGLLEVARRSADPTAKPALIREWRWFLVLGSPIMIMLTWARGNWAGLFLAVWLFVLLGRPLVQQSKRLVFIGVLLVVIPAALIAVQTLVPASIFEERIGETDNVEGRLETWKIALREAVKQPVLGIGLNNTRDLLGEERTAIEGGHTYTTVHNSFLTFFAELGVVGLLLYLSIVFSIGKIGWHLYRKGATRVLRWRGAAVLAVLVGYLVPGFFANTIQMFGFGHLVVFSFLGALIGVSYRPENLLADELPMEAASSRKLGTPVTGVGAVPPAGPRTIGW